MTIDPLYPLGRSLYGRAPKRGKDCEITMNSTDQQIAEFLTRSVENVYPKRDALEELLESGKKIRVYLGVDPTGPTLHIGHAIAIRKLAELQRMGHEVILLIGDFTAMIGDPTDKSATRKQLTHEEVLANCKNYQSQASAFLQFDGENPAKLMFNNNWLGKMSFAEVVELASHFTVQQMLERDMFEKRMNEQKPIGIHEFMYPLMQGYDSVAMDVNLEIGGNDQTFNMLAGRTLMREMKGEEKLVLTTKLLVRFDWQKDGEERRQHDRPIGYPRRYVWQGDELDRRDDRVRVRTLYRRTCG